ncbi:MAG: peptidoglycan-binding protein [Rhodopila sp.]
MLQHGSRGEAVKGLQMRLRTLGFNLVVDGDFGPATETAVKRLQAAHKLEADGIVEPRTWAALEAVN